MSERFKLQDLGSLVDALSKGGLRILAPREKDGRVEFDEVSAGAQLPNSYFQAIGSAKQAVFPRVEKILGFTTDKEPEVQDPAVLARPTAIVGSRPCEARSFAALDAVFNWDYRDKFFNERMAQTTVVTMGCTESDGSCFCTSLGSNPRDTAGSDVFLTPLAAGGFAAEALTDKGRALLAKARLTALTGDIAPAPAPTVEKTFDAKELTAKLASKFNDPVWLEQSLRCLGCGACAYVCPTCLCFDVQDEPTSRQAGQRLRLWDSCGLRLFTLHTSGHNPRDNQASRWRQRVMHKFSYYPERQKMLGCVGCGKCSRACPVDMNLKKHLTEAAR